MTRNSPNQVASEKILTELIEDKFDHSWALMFMEYFPVLDIEVDNKEGEPTQLAVGWSEIFSYFAPMQLRSKGLLPQQLAVNDFLDRYQDIAASINSDDPCRIAMSYIVLVVTKVRTQAGISGKPIALPGPGNIQKMANWLAKTSITEV
jgi:hypothetical protein